MKNKIFIPFIDGLLNFDCQECGYACCRTTGYLMMNKKEKKALLQEYPYLRYFFSRDTNSSYFFDIYTDCWFLGEDGSCWVQKKNGYSYKPFLCRLHPFYVWSCRNEFVVVPSDLCRLSVAPGKESSSHKLILKNASEAISYGHYDKDMNWTVGRLDLEKLILKNSKDFLDRSNYIDFCTHQIFLAEKNKNSEKIRAELSARLKLWRSFLEIESLDIENKRITYELTVLTPLLRVGSPLFREMDTKEIPLVLLAAYLYRILFSKILDVKIYVKSYKQILADFSSGLICLKDSDLKIKFRSLEDKINYLRGLNKMYVHSHQANLKKKGRKPR